jgi:hypothetical protein
MKFLNATIDGRWTRVRIDGPRTAENVEFAAGRAAARSVGRKAAHVVTVRTEGWRPGFVRLFSVAVATGPRRHGLTPIVNVTVNVEMQPDLA